MPQFDKINRIFSKQYLNYGQGQQNTSLEALCDCCDKHKYTLREAKYN